MPTATPEIKEVKSVVEVDEPQKKFYPNYRVILHNDDSVAAEYVVIVLNEVMGYDETKAVSIMMEAHTTGKGEVIVVTSEEHAEHYSDQLNSKGLTTSIEEMEV